MKNIFITFCMAVVLGSTFTVATPVLAEGSKPTQDGYFLLDFKCSGEEIINSEQTCNFKDFMTLFGRIITLLLYIAITLGVISFVYAGYLLLFSGGNEEALKHAKHIFWNVVVGLVLAYGAWVIVYFVIEAVGGVRSPEYNMVR